MFEACGGLTIYGFEGSSAEAYANSCNIPFVNMSNTAPSTGASNQLVLTIGKCEAMLFGKTVSNDVAPLLKNDRTMLPARFVAEALGAEVGWCEKEQKVRIAKGETEIILTVNSDKAYVNDEEITLDSPAFIENDRTYTPVRFIVENLGAKVEWNDVTQEVIITQ
ncbi:MAG: copper amine oxidase N-terminal domain-containing protein [Clostridia bacterium]|nr:copper amine oxidase N-terminal domain-containing protein [Clostridia bacterium]